MLMVCKKTSNQTRQWSFLKVVKVDGFSSSILRWKLPFLKYNRFHFFSELYNCNEKPFPFFFTPQGIQYPPLDRCYSYKMLVFIKCAVFRKEFAVFLFPSAMSERQERIIIESLKFTGTIYTIIKCFKVIWKLISLVKISLTKQVSLLDLLSCDNIIKSYTHFFI